MQKAIKDTETGISIRAAARKRKVPESTLRGRLHGAGTLRESRSQLQRLSPDQEQHLANWALAQGSLGLAPTNTELKELAQRVLAVAGEFEPLGRNWMDGFLRRNPSLRTVRGKFIGSQLVEAVAT
ncbi:uncharacterized protein CTRU02_209419 [Colletotrichum truncatum]|uniref:Uncharacterized protein n=1 Tax=Colletotrichum truncatum TaxID=5467 RepID=A0ACC3YSB5_COLTU|nr:uncharacterized protein CTRU02_08503 [Colletotrichum truncatum]KAF6789804.1 hypothetical protein CTRU02_08503 [Colletotrichum truncatum]